MAMSIGATQSSSGNQTTVSSFTISHTTDANTKCLVVVVTGVDSSATDSVVSGVTWGGAALAEIAGGRYRVGNDFISIWYKSLPVIAGPANVAVTMAGSCTDVQGTAINLVDAAAATILYDNFDTGTGTNAASSIINPAKSGSIAIGGAVADGGTAGSLSVSTGTESVGSEVDMGSQCASVGYASESGGTAVIVWSYAAVTVSSLAATFYSQYTPTTVLNTPTDTATGVSVTPTLNFTGTDTNADEVEYEVQVDTVNTFDGGGGSDGVDVYYFDSSDAATTDPNNVFSNDANGFDGNNISTAASSTVGSASSNFLKSEGTNATDLGGTISLVEASLYGSGAMRAEIYTDGLGENLGTITFSDSGVTYYNLSTPAGGWTWAKVQALEAKAYATSATLSSISWLRVRVTHQAVPLISALSTDHTGFSAGASHPTASGVEQTYTPSDISINTYSFDAHLNSTPGTPIDADSAWTNDNNVFDSDFTPSTSGYANSSIPGSTSTKFLHGKGTTASSGYTTITQVRARMYGYGLTGVMGHAPAATIYTESLGESLGEITVVASSGTWGSYLTLTTPSGGWTWEKLTKLETKVYATAGGGSGDDYVYKIEIEVTASQTHTLAANTPYYWRVRAIDPLGSNTYGAWATTRSFTTIIDINVNDAISVSENSSVSIEGQAGELSINVFDSISTSESSIIDLEIKANTSDPLATSESLNITLVYDSNVNDPTTVTESVKVTPVSDVSVSDNVSIIEDLGLLETSLINTNDNTSVSEIVNTASSFNSSVSESTALSENVSVAITYQAIVSDATTIGESIKTLIESYINVSDSTAVTEQVGVLLDSFININDPVVVTESIATDGVPNIVATESITTTENPVINREDPVVRQVVATDNISTIESIGLSVSDLQIAVNEVLSISENVNGLLASFVSVNDSVVTTEDDGLLLIDLINVSDSVGTAETITSGMGDLQPSVLGTAIVDSYSESNQTVGYGIQNFGKGGDGFGGAAQSFMGDGGTLSNIKLYLNKYGVPTGNAFMYIYAHSGTFGTSSVPTGAALATSDALDVSTLTTSFQLTTFNFTGANKIVIENTTNYVVAIQYTGGVFTGDYISVGFDNTSPTHSGNASHYTNSTSSWSADSGGDLCFYVYKDYPVPISESVSVIESKTVFLEEDRQINSSENINVSESNSLIVSDLFPAVTDTILATDISGAQIELTSFINTSDNTIATEDLKTSQTSLILTADQVSISETIATQNSYLSDLHITDQISISESFTGSVLSTLIFIVNDQLGVSENVSVMTGDSQVSLTENISVTENINTVLVNLFNTSDSISISETCSIELMILSLIFETVSINESISVSPLILPGIQTSENASISEYIRRKFKIDEWELEDKEVSIWVNDPETTTGYLNEAAPTSTWTNEAVATQGWSKRYNDANTWTLEDGQTIAAVVEYVAGDIITTQNIMVEELLSVFISFPTIISDSLTISEDITIHTGNNVWVQDYISISESTSLSIV